MTRVPIPGDRDVTASLDDPGDAEACVVACPPHPEAGGRRTDRRLQAVAAALNERGVACLRFDYGPWDEGRGERRDAENALDWAADRYDRTGLFGYSFGGTVTILVAADRDDLSGVAALAPNGNLGDERTADAVARIDAPTLVVYGERDDVVTWGPVVERATAVGHAVEAFAADHHFVGQHERVAATVADFLASHLA